jgi:mono/diheme cytochrome c family protein
MRLSSSGLVLLTLCWAASVNAQEDAGEEPARGAAVYEYWCATCHSAGPGMPGTQALAVKYNGNPPAVLIERPDLTPEFISVIVRTGVSVMPPFRKTEITDAELAALGEYIVATARGTGDR